MKKLIHSLIILGLSLMSCGGSNEPDTPQDKEKPEIKLIEPVQNEIIKKGAYLELTGILTDDVELDQLTVIIEHLSTKTTSGFEEPWQPEVVTISIEGKTKELKSFRPFDHAVPSDCLSGLYSLKLQLFDGVGNEITQSIEINIQ
ncbi:MAG: DUF4625 domain-containing protein [Carboxylicivirga sp.]|jgi:hypothetical protein|nr:DUF4625 domain-containing protein [Carboxylicivirga sp.]